MTSRYGYLSGTFLILFASSLPARQAPSQGVQGVNESAQILGFVRDADTHEPVVSARVDLMSPNGMASPTRYTNSNGEFSFGGVGDGDYRVVIKKMGYQDHEEAVSVIASHQSRVEVDLRRTNPDSPAAPSSAETISAHQLTVPEKARQEYLKGKESLEKNDFSEAVSSFQRAIKDFPSYYEAYADMGRAQYMAGDAAEARTSLQKSIDLSKGKFADALFNLADVYNDTSDFPDAERLARQQIAIEDSSWRGYFELARSLLGLKRYPEAEQNARKAQALNGEFRMTYVILTNIHIATRQYAAAAQDIDGYLKLDPNSPTAGQMRATRAQLTKVLSASSVPSSKKSQ